MAFRDDDHRTRERPRWIPWWGWVLLVLGLLLLIAELIGIAYHRAGMQALREEMIAQVARGQGRSPRDLLATQPTVDQALQDRAAAMIATWPSYLQMQAVGLEARCLSGWNAPSAEQRDREVSTFRKEMPGAINDWRTFAGRERLTLSSAGWQATNVLVDDVHLERRYKENSFRLETLAKALATEAWTTADPRPALADLDALAAAVGKAVRNRDFQTLHSVGQVRDESWLEAYVRGLTSDAWIGSLPNLVQEMQNALKAERLRTMADLWRDESSTSIKVPDPSQNPFGIFNLAVPDLVDVPWMRAELLRFRTPFDVRNILQSQTTSEDALRGTLSPVRAAHRMPPWCEPVSRLLNSRQGMHLVQELDFGSAWRTVNLEHRQRRVRIAALLTEHFRAIGDVPDDLAQADARCHALAAATGPIPGITYQRLGPGHFLLSLDTTGPANPILSAYPPRSPIIKNVAYRNSDWTLEMDLTLIPSATQPFDPERFTETPSNPETPRKKRRKIP